MSDEIKHDEVQQKAEADHKALVAQSSPSAISVAERKPRGGFMNGGALTTALFLIAFFLVSYSLGFTTSQYNKLATGVIPNSVANQGQAGNQQAAGQQPAQATGLQDGATVTEKLTAEDARTKGDKNAKVTMYEYSDFECPFCGNFFTGAYKQIEEKYVKTGKVKVVFKDFPLTFHANAQKSAEAARCAQEQGKFWEMHDKLFSNQKSLTTDNYKKWAGEMGVKSDQFNQCLDSGKYADAVKKDLAEGVKIGIQGTPSFVINGQALIGAYPFEEFEKVIEEKLK